MTSYSGTGLRVEVNGTTVGTWGVAPVGIWTARTYFQLGADMAVDDLVLTAVPVRGWGWRWWCWARWGSES